MFDVGVETSRLPEPEMITCQYCPGLIGIPGSRSWAPGRVSLHSLQPTDQVSCGAPDRRGSRQRVRLIQVQSAHARDAGDGLGSDLNEIVLPRERHGSADDRVLCRFRNGRPAAFRPRRGWPRVTGHERPTHQEDAAENPTARRVAAYAAQDGGEPYAWIEVHADLLQW
jgi:hypothetical protein